MRKNKIINLFSKISSEWKCGLFSKTTIIISCFALLICCGASVKIIKDKLNSTMSARISLTYQEAANGLNPNETRFNPYSILSNEIVSKAEIELGFTLDKEELWL